MNKNEHLLPFRNQIIPTGKKNNFLLRDVISKVLVVMIASVLSIGIAHSSSLAATYYIDGTNGNDSRDGSLSNPWKTIGKANSKLRAGDTVLIKKGTYREVIKPANSGSSAGRITYKNYKSDKVQVTGPGAETPVYLNKNYITINGLHVKMSNPPKTTKVNIDITGDHNEILNVSIVNTKNRMSERSSGIKEMGIRIQDGSHTRIQNCSIHYLSFNGVKLSTANHTIIRDNEITDNYSNSISILTTYKGYSGIVIENNTLGGSVVSDGIQFNGNYSAADYGTDYSNRGAIIRGNVIMGSAENGIDLKGTAHVLVENNIIYGSTGNNDGSIDGNNDRYGGVGGIMHGANSESRDVIIRGNVFYDNMCGIQLFDGWKLYNNTIIGNNRDYTGPNSTFQANAKPSFVGVVVFGNALGTAVKNNIIAGHTTGEVTLQPKYVRGVDIDYNLYYNLKGVKLIPYTAKSDWDLVNFDSWKAMLKNYSNIKGKDQHSMVANPKFDSNGMSVTPVGDYGNRGAFELDTRSSIAIDKGGPLTYTTNSGSGNKVYVADAGYFTDGFGAVQGDIIKIGSNKTVRITKADYNSNVLTVNSSVTWSKGDSVSLSYAGNGPDIGAVEHGASPSQPLIVDDQLNPPTLEIVNGS